MKTIKLTRREVALVDDEDFELLSMHKWYAVKSNNTFYARTTINGKQISMHRLLCGYKGVDHIDGNGLNNQRANLRWATPQQNAANSRPKGGMYSRYKGVTDSHGRWCASITINSKTKYLGLFRTEEDAARAYDDAAIIAFGEFAKINFPESA